MHRGGGVLCLPAGPHRAPSFSPRSQALETQRQLEARGGGGSPLGLAAGGYVSLEETVTGWISEEEA